MEPLITFLNPYDIKETEHHLPEKLPALKEKILSEGIWRVPITVEKSSLVVMDGHHRLQTAKSLGLSLIPCIMLGYESVIVESRRPDILVTPEEIIRRGLAGDLYPAKSTRHIFSSEYSCHVPLSELVISQAA